MPGSTELNIARAARAHFGEAFFAKTLQFPPYRRFVGREPNASAIEGPLRTCANGQPAKSFEWYDATDRKISCSVLREDSPPRTIRVAAAAVIRLCADYPRRGRGLDSPKEISTSRPRRLASADYPRRGRVVAATRRNMHVAAAASTRLRGMSTSRPRRCRDSSPQNSRHGLLASTEHPQHSFVSSSARDRYLRRFRYIYRDAGVLPTEIFQIEYGDAGLCLDLAGGTREWGSALQPYDTVTATPCEPGRKRDSGQWCRGRAVCRGVAATPRAGSQ